MRSDLVVIDPPRLTFTRASSRLKNQEALRHSARTRPLKDSANALSVGFPGRLKSSSEMARRNCTAG